MDQLRRILATIQQHLGSLSVTHKLLAGSLAVILVMALFLVAQYAGRPEMVELLPGAAPEQQDRALAFLRTSGIPHEVLDGRIVVPVDQQRAALAQLGEAGQLPRDTTLIFENMLKNQSWLRSREENRQLYKVMLINELNAIISRYAGVRRAEVMLDIPEPAGLGAAVRLPKASITLHAEPGQTLAQATVDAAAKMVAGSVAGLDLERVTVIDGSSGKPRRVTREDELAASTYAEYAAALERHFKARILNLVSHIEGVVVEVTAAVDVSRVRSQVQKHLPVGEGTVAVPKSERSTSQTEGQAVVAAEPGLRANTGADINTGGGGTVRSEHTEEETEFAVGIGTRSNVIEDPRGMPTRLVATINVPRSYILALLRGAADADAAGGEPTEEQVQQQFQRTRQSIEEAVRPHVRTVTAGGEVVEGDVVVALVAGAGAPAFGAADRAGLLAAPGTGGALGTILAAGGGLVDKAVLIALAALAVGMMLLMVRKASRRAKLPTAQELVGIPPTLEPASDLVGEADETDTAMMGIEIGDEAIKSQKMLEQVNEMIRNHPEQAGRLLSRWVAAEG